MKKLTFLGSTILSLLTPVQVFAQINVLAPEKGFKTLGNFISNVLTLVMVIGGLAVLVMLIWGAFEWITSGGDKDAVAHARNRIINALIGLAVMAVTFALARVFAQFVGLDLTNLAIPTPNQSPNPSAL